MHSSTPARATRRFLGGVVMGAGVSLLALVVVLSLRPLSASAQGDALGLTISKTLEGGSTVQVGEVLTFDIRIGNTGTFTITSLRLIDTFDDAIVWPSGVAPYAKPGDPPLSDPPGTLSGNTITWDNVLATPLGPGESLSIKVRLRAVHPRGNLTVVNQARIAEAVSSSGQQGGGGESQARGDARGGRTPVFKKLATEGDITAGMPVSYVIFSTNQGAADVTLLPLSDTFDGNALQFVSASPPPSSVSAPAADGRVTLRWDNLVAAGATLKPGERVEVRTEFIARGGGAGGVNLAVIQGARDEYNNELEAQRAEAPIRVVVPTATVGPTQPAATQPAASATAVASQVAATATVRPTERRRPRDEQKPSATPASEATATEVAATATLEQTASAPEAPTAAATDVTTAATETPLPATETPSATATLPVPSSLPPTGGGASGVPWLAFAALLLAVGLVMLVRLRES